MYWRGLDDPAQVRWSDNGEFKADIVFQQQSELVEHLHQQGLDITDLKTETNSNVKVAVVTQSYYRKDGSSKRHLNSMFDMLKRQTYSNFKVFITGDDYQPVEEFNSICAEYDGDIDYANNTKSFRTLDLGDIRNYWTTGGLLAAKASYIRAKHEGYDIALMLDDDDHWSNNHIETVVGTFIKWYEAAFVVTLSQYGVDPNSYMPHGITPGTSEPVYNNYIPVGCTCVRSSTAHNLHLLSDDTLSLWKEIEESAMAVHAADKNDKGMINPADAQLLDRVGTKVRNGEYKSICCPIKTVTKLSDANWNNIPTPGLARKRR